MPSPYSFLICGLRNRSSGEDDVLDPFGRGSECRLHGFHHKIEAHTRGTPFSMRRLLGQVGDMDQPSSVAVLSGEVQRVVEGLVAYVCPSGVGDVSREPCLPPSRQDSLDGKRGEVGSRSALNNGLARWLGALVVRDGKVEDVYGDTLEGQHAPPVRQAQ